MSCQVDPAKAAAAKEDKKRKAVEDGEKAWLVRACATWRVAAAPHAHAPLVQAKLAASAPGGDAAADATKDEGFIKAYLETIMGNLQLSITNVHVRFEGELPGAGPAGGPARFAAGITLHELSAITTDASGSEAFEAKARAARNLAMLDADQRRTCRASRLGSTSAQPSSALPSITIQRCVTATSRTSLVALRSHTFDGRRHQCFQIQQAGRRSRRTSGARFSCLASLMRRLSR